MKVDGREVTGSEGRGNRNDTQQKSPAGLIDIEITCVSVLNP